MTTQLTPIQQLTGDLANQKKQIASMLPPNMDPKRFLRTAVSAVSTHPQRDSLLKADRESLFNACQKAAGDGLLIDGKEATLVTFSGQVAYMPMVQGLVKLARNSGEITSIVSEVVYENDEFTYRPGTDDSPLFNPDWFGDRGAPIGCYAVVTTKEGEKITSVMRADRILAIGKGGKNFKQYDPKQGAHYTEWWKKTAIKNVLKYAPKSTYLEQAMEHDNEHVDMDAIPATEPQAQGPASTEDINAELSAAKKVDQGTGEILEGDYTNNSSQNAVDESPQDSDPI